MPRQFLTTEDLQLRGSNRNLRLGIVQDGEENYLVSTYAVEGFYEEVYIYQHGVGNWKWYKRLHRGWKINEPHTLFDREINFASGENFKQVVEKNLGQEL